MPQEKNIPYYNVNPQMFEAQMKYLKDHHFNVMTLEEFLNIKDSNFKKIDHYHF
jgi:hypothetical protein